MKPTYLALSLLFTLTAANAAVVGCKHDDNHSFEKLTEGHKVELLVTQPIEVEKGDYKSGDNFELWMKLPSEKARTIKANEAARVTSMELLGDDANPDLLIFHFGDNNHGVDTFAFSSRDSDSVIKKLKESKILTLTCTPKK